MAHGRAQELSIVIVEGRGFISEPLSKVILKYKYLLNHSLKSFLNTNKKILEENNMKLSFHDHIKIIKDITIASKKKTKN